MYLVFIILTVGIVTENMSKESVSCKSIVLVNPTA
jgi:hypothetical protein